MKHKILTSTLIGLIALAACTQTPNDTSNTTSNANKISSVVGITNLGIGIDNTGARPAAALADSALTFVLPGTYNNTTLTGSTDKFITATFGVTANQAFDNLTLYAVAKSGNIGGTALNTILDFGNNPITSAANAQKVKPTHAMQTDATTINANKADLQFFHIAEAALAQQQARAAGFIGNADEVLEYGFVARRCTANCATATPTWTRAFSSGDTGEITIALRLPVGATVSDDPYRFNMSFLIANEPVMRFTRSTEEGVANTTNVVDRANAIAGAKEVAFRGGPNGVVSGCTTCTAIQFENIKTSSAPTYIVTPAAGTNVVSGVIKAPYITSGSPEALGIPAEAEFVQGQAIVKFKTFNAGQAAARALAVDNQEPLYGTTMVLTAQNTPTVTGLDSIQADSATAVNTLAFIAQLRTRDDVEWAVPNYIDRAHITTPNDPLYPVQTTTTNPNNIWHYSMAKINSAWDTTTGTPNVRVAVLDTGILYNKADYIGNDTNATREPNTNPDLYCSTNKWRPGYDFVSYSNTSDNDAVDDDDPYDLGPNSGTSFHGTHVAGTIGACTNNTTGIAGIGWGVEMMAVRVLGPLGGQRSDIIRGMLWAAGIQVSTTTTGGTSNITNPFPADVLNMSLGGAGTDQAYQDAIDQINAAGKIVVVSAGNNNDNSYKYAPAGQNGVITVGSVGPTATIPRRAYYSNYGSAVEITAPGGDLVTAPVTPRGVLSTQGCTAAGTGQPNPTTGCAVWGYTEFQGTSMSAPHIAGIIALMNSARLAQAVPLPKLNVYEATYYLQSTATPLTAANDCANGCGAGLVDAQAAVNAAIANTFPGPFLQFKNAFSATTGLPGLDLTTSGTTGNLTLENMTATAGNYTLTTSNGFLSATVAGNTTGTLNGNATTTVNVTLNRTGLADGAYVGSIIATVGSQSTTAPVFYVQGSASNPIGRLLVESLRWNNSTGFDANMGRMVMKFVPGLGYPYRFTQMTQNRRFVIQAYSDDNSDGRSEYYRCFPRPTTCSASSAGTFAVVTSDIANQEVILSTSNIGITNPY